MGSGGRLAHVTPHDLKTRLPEPSSRSVVSIESGGLSGLPAGKEWISKRVNDPATPEDVRQGRAVFSVPDGKSRVFSLGTSFPIAAVLVVDITRDDGAVVPAGTAINIVQVEIVDEKDILVGFRYGNSEEGLCLLEDTNIGAGGPLEMRDI